MNFRPGPSIQSDALFFTVTWQAYGIPLFSSSETKFQKGVFCINCLKRGLSTKHKIITLSHTPEKNPIYQSAQNSFAELRQNNPKI